MNTYKLLNDENELANYEILTTNASYNATMQYDGFISLFRSESGGWEGTITRGVSVFTINARFSYTGFANEYSVKKGDIVSISSGIGLTVLGSFYKKRNYSYR